MDLLDEKFFENDYIMTAIDEIEFIRSPMYEISKAYKMNYEGVEDLMEEIHLKSALTTDFELMGLKYPHPNRENVAFKRYADISLAPEADKYMFQQPRGEPLRRNFTGEIFKY